MNGPPPLRPSAPAHLQSLTCLSTVPPISLMDCHPLFQGSKLSLPLTSSPFVFMYNCLEDIWRVT